MAWNDLYDSVVLNKSKIADTIRTVLYDAKRKSFQVNPDVIY